MRDLREHKKNRKKGIMGILLSLVLVMAMVPALPVKADTETIPEGWIPINSIDDIQSRDYQGNAGGKYILMNNDTETGMEIISKNWDIILDFNGHTTNHNIYLTGNDSSPKGSFTVKDSKGGGGIMANLTYACGVQISSNYSFTLEGGTISSSASGLATTPIYNDGTFNMTGGAISGNTTTSISGGVHNNNSGTFNMYGGTISGNTANKDVGGVLNFGTFNMYGGTVSANTSTSSHGHPGGVANSGTFNMYGGTISNNTAPEIGGVLNDGTFNMTGGEITGNHGATCAGIQMIASSYQSSTISGGTIRDNLITGTTESEDVYIRSSVSSNVACQLSGAPDIGSIKFVCDTSSNPSAEPSCLTLTGPLSNKTPIKIDVEGISTPFTFTQKSATGPKPADYIEYFTACDPNKGIGYSGNELVLADAAKPPVISGTSADISLDLGYTSSNPLSVSATAVEGHELSYQWYSNTTDSNKGGTKIAGATAATYNLPTGLTAGDTYYYCVVTSTNRNTHVTNSLASRAIKVTVTAAADRYESSNEGNTTWSPDSRTPLRFVFKTVTGDDDILKRFAGVEVDGVTVPEKDSSGRPNWIASQGSLIIDLQPDYLDTLSVGDHTLSAVFDDGSKITTSFSIAQPPEVLNETTTAPNTGEGKDFTVYIALLLMYIAMVMTAAVGGTKAIEYSQRRKRK